MQDITSTVFHPSGLYHNSKEKPKFILPCVFSLTGFVKRPATLEEQCSMWDISNRVIKLLSNRQLIELWNIQTNRVKLLQYALLHTVLTVFGPGGGT